MGESGVWVREAPRAKGWGGGRARHHGAFCGGRGGSHLPARGGASPRSCPRPTPARCPGPSFPCSFPSSLPRGFRGGGSSSGSSGVAPRGQVPLLPGPICCLVWLGAAAARGAPRALRGSRAATTEQPRDWPPRAPFAAVPFPGALTPFSGWDCSGGADSAGIAATEAAAAAAAEQGSMFSPGQEEHCAPNKEPVKYGELVVLG